jgi:homoserine dehydrogenase
MDLRIAFMGCGNVGRSFIAMVAEKQAELWEQEGLRLLFSAGMTRSRGGWVLPEGITAQGLLACGWPQADAPLPPGARRFEGSDLSYAATCPSDVLLELTTLEPMSGQPATDYIRAALEHRRHVVTANKGPIAHYYWVLRALAASHGVALRFESTVMDGTPIFNLKEFSLPVTRVKGFRGLLNGTSNYVLATMAAGSTLDEAVAGAQRMGIAEANPGFDLEGWDASVKASVLARVLMDADLRPPDVVRDGLGAQAMRAAHEALTSGHALKQLVEAARDADGGVSATVRLAALPADDPLARLKAGETGLTLHTDTMDDLTWIEGNGGTGQTAFGVLADVVTIARQYYTRKAPPP